MQNDPSGDFLQGTLHHVRVISAGKAFVAANDEISDLLTSPVLKSGLVNPGVTEEARRRSSPIFSA